MAGGPEGGVVALNLPLWILFVALGLIGIIILGFLFGLGFWLARFYIFEEAIREAQRQTSEVD